jgi:signal transduction histidine kinase
MAAIAVGSDVAELQWKLVVLPVFFALPGAMIAAGRPRVPIGWLLLAAAGLLAGAAFGAEWATADRPGAAWAIWWTDRFSAYAVPCVLLMLLLLPDGRLPSPRWRPVAAAAVASQVVLVTTYAFAKAPAAGEDTSFPAGLRDLKNPVGVLPASVEEAAGSLEPWLLQAPLLLALVAIVVHLWRGYADDRLRLGEVLLAAAVFIVLSVLGHTLWPAAADVFDVLGAALLGISITVAVLRRQLGGLDVVLHHSFVYAVLTALIALGYAGVVALLARVGVSLPPFGQGVVTAGIALAMLPVRGRLQRAVTTALYGDRSNPYAAVRRLDAQLTGTTTLAEALDGIARTTTAALRVPWAAVEVEGHCAQHGNRRPGLAATVLKVADGSGHPMTMSVACPPGRRLTPGDEQLLDDLARQGGRTVTALLLAEALLASRQQLVTAREEERARLRRDLHDELGPTLAGLVMQLAGLRQLLEESPDLAGARVSRLEGAARAALEDVRRVSRELRPPSLDELGLEGALHDYAARLGLTASSTATPLPHLPPAVEVAAYRIGAEALTNIARHAQTTRAALAVQVDADHLSLTITDDGVGWGGEGIGVGVVAMRERAEELGGWMDIDSVSGVGTAVKVRLPLPSVPPEVPA